MKQISLSKNKYAIVDDGDYEYLNQWKWFCHSDGYAVRSIQRNNKHFSIYMHRAILNTPPDMCTDHINHNRLDNRRSNLRLCTRAQNQWNSPIPKNNTSGKKCVYWSKERKKWYAKISYRDKLIHLGYFDNIDNADIAYREAAKKYFGEFAYTGDHEHE